MLPADAPELRGCCRPWKPRAACAFPQHWARGIFSYIYHYSLLFIIMIYYFNSFYYLLILLILLFIFIFII